MVWLVSTLRAYPELAIFLALAIGFWIGPKKVAGFSLGNVTATHAVTYIFGTIGSAIILAQLGPRLTGQPDPGCGTK